jgi:hypothetical protein
LYCASVGEGSTWKQDQQSENIMTDAKRYQRQRRPPSMAYYTSAALFCLPFLLDSYIDAWSPAAPNTAIRHLKSYSQTDRRTNIHFPPLRAGADIEQPPVDEAVIKNSGEFGSKSADIPTTTPSMRGKVNEIDFCIAPADVSLSRAYGTSTSPPSSSGTDSASVVGLSLTRALNNASNRAVRRILLARSWPSAEALNESLRQVAALEAARAEQQISKGAKCPVPRPILNVLTRNQRQQSEGDCGKAQRKAQPKPRSRTDEEYVADQLLSFLERYGTLTGYAYAQDYLECVLSLATSGLQSEKAQSVLSAGIYDEAYKRVLAVLKSVGVKFEKDPKTNRLRIADKLQDKDICLSMIDKIQMRNGADVGEGKAMYASDAEILAEEETTELETDEDSDVAAVMVENKPVFSKSKKGLKFWQRNDVALSNDDLGAVLLSAKEPTMTRQLNSLSNIVQRALLFGGDQELLVLAETLDADRAAFIERWYPRTSATAGSSEEETEKETRPGVRYLNSLVILLRKCYDDGVVTNLYPPVRLTASYANAYERLVASSVELGSGYLRPTLGNGVNGFDSSVASLPKPRTAQEELGRFAVWETQFRKSADASTAYSPYPQDLVGSWEVRDVIGGETIGTSKVSFEDSGNVVVEPPLEGLRWRLDPGPTHLDTCTFQVLSTLDGTILQYRGFIDRGARLEARFSKRPTTIRGSVMFQMRDGASVDYYKDILPINYRTGTTKFVMTKTS